MITAITYGIGNSEMIIIAEYKHYYENIIRKSHDINNNNNDNLNNNSKK